MSDTQEKTRFNGVGPQKVLPVCLPPETVDRLNAEASERGINRSAMVRQALQDFFANEKRPPHLT